MAPVQLGALDGALYTAPSATVAKIGRAVFVNISGAPVTLTAGINVGALTPASTLINARPLGVGESYVAPELAGAVIPAASQLRAYASSPASISCSVSGATIV